MNAPDVTATYLHPCDGRRYRIHEVGELHLILVRVDVHEPGISYLTRRETFDEHFVKVEDLVGLADVVGALVDALREPGQQPAVEFTTGPTTNGPIWSDANLARVFGLDGTGWTS